MIITTDYQILQTEPYMVDAVPNATTELEGLVGALLPTWEPLGGPQWIHQRIGGDYRLMQAMVKKEDTEE